jgi:hypothetical protein
MSQEGWSEVKRKKTPKNSDSWTPKVLANASDFDSKTYKQKNSTKSQEDLFRGQNNENGRTEPNSFSKSVQDNEKVQPFRFPEESNFYEKKSNKPNLSSSGEISKSNYNQNSPKSFSGPKSSFNTKGQFKGTSDKNSSGGTNSSPFYSQKGANYGKNNHQQHYKMIDPSDEKAVEKRKEEIRKMKAGKVPEFLSKEEEEKFNLLKKEIPHLKMPQEVRKMQILENIDDLENKLLSEEWITLQAEGWEFMCVVKPDDQTPPPEDTKEIKYELYPLENKWGDYALFKLQQKL